MKILNGTFLLVHHLIKFQNTNILGKKNLYFWVIVPCSLVEDY